MHVRIRASEKGQARLEKWKQHERKGGNNRAFVHVKPASQPAQFLNYASSSVGEDKNGNGVDGGAGSKGNGSVETTGSEIGADGKSRSDATSGEIQKTG